MNVRLTEQYAALNRGEHLRRAGRQRMAASAARIRTRDRNVVVRDFYLHRRLERLGVAAAGSFAP